jgi:hypothetical protein
MQIRTAFLILITGVLGACAQEPTSVKPDYPTLFMTRAELSSKEIVQNAYEAAGGVEWTRPKSLSMDGYAVFYKNGVATKNESHKMWRVYDAGKKDAHSVDGKVRIISVRNGEPFYNLSFDGETTYTADGPQPKSEADQRWASSFGFGVIRHALDEEYKTERLPDDLIDGRPAYLVKVIDPVGGSTQFGIAQDDFAVLKVGFNTPRGWHERIYSHFYSNTGDKWVQPGRVRLYYDGAKANEVIWTSYTINNELPDCLFVLPESEECRAELGMEERDG